ncbi:MAG: hypothetical protein Rubg2KO_29120 [Rubricoccaceae bacterium]
MESDAPRPDEPRPPAASDEPARTEWRALARLRERVETAAREIERLRAENAELAAQVAESGGPALPLDGEPEDVRAQIQGFIDAIDRVLEAPEASADETTA